ncbi:MAG: methylated-DNA--[protein]-cysteine S-methyltransferase [Coriobacteriia bacterium]|nr:methylated-DNA--[protein]-cysteine S-methyltransferase [Coriobacteriia bacterium]
MLYYTEYVAPFGTLTIASDSAREAVCGLWFPNHKYEFEGLPELPVRNDACPVLAELARWLDAYFAGKRPAIGALPLAPYGSEFRQAVWNILREIPYGETTSYGEISQQVAATRGKASPRSVGGAVGHNPISIVVPCHRVVGANRSLTGFGGGMPAKVWLLEHEGHNMSTFTVPTKGTAL